MQSCKWRVSQDYFTSSAHAPLARRIADVNICQYRQSVASRRTKHRPAKYSTIVTATSSVAAERQEAISGLLEAVQDTKRGVENSQDRRQRVLNAVKILEAHGKDQVTTKGPIDATWKLVWTTEKETLFILKNARLFGTEAGNVYQVIDTGNSKLQNVITFKNGASFVVDSTLESGGEKRLVFKFTGAKLNLPSKTWRLPPFGKGWFDTVYLDENLRVAKDIRGDTLVVKRDGPPRLF